ncbi:MAG: hypothetical protein NVS1B10_01200 [Candidatus Saccharimonadales bacterium]
MTNVLLIEPDRILAETYASYLSDSGYQVVACAGAQAAIIAADQTRPDIIILELQLIEHSGIEFLYELRSYPEWQDIPVVIHSWVPIIEFKDTWTALSDELNVHDYLYKPQVTMKKLESCIEKTLV